MKPNLTISLQYAYKRFVVRVDKPFRIGNNVVADVTVVVLDGGRHTLLTFYLSRSTLKYFGNWKVGDVYYVERKSGIKQPQIEKVDDIWLNEHKCGLGANGRYKTYGDLLIDICIECKETYGHFKKQKHKLCGAIRCQRQHQRHLETHRFCDPTVLQILPNDQVFLPNDRGKLPNDQHSI